MFKKSLLMFSLACTPFLSYANWNAGVNYINVSSDSAGSDISLSGIAGSIGYLIPSGNNLFLMPELKVGVGLADDTITLAGDEVTIEMDQYLSLSFRGQYAVGRGGYVFAAPTYTYISSKATGNVAGSNVSAGADEWEFGVGVGAGYMLTDFISAELVYEKYSDTDILNLGVKFHF